MMTLRDLIAELDLEVIVGEDELDKPIEGGYCSDLLSFVMSRSAKNYVWITLQSHPNIVAVASLVDLAAVIVTEGVQIEQETLDKAKREKAVILRSQDTSYEIAGQLYQLGVKSHV
ncbi:HPr kinase [Natranaerobius thermophilus JW/NM-WN-LF]|uniref:HPr kinase n=2 Tax=Natranaerobius TaxID=375928 RepID=B2A3R7_NATTJ|nr:HPr kinase [Natranaerobius thermophilus JW/NM-WN-LF]